MNSEIDMSSVVDEMKVDDTKTIQCLCGGHYTGSYRRYHFQSQKHQKYLKESGTKDDDLLKPGQTRCYCGGRYKETTKSEHFKTRNHRMFCCTKEFRSKEFRERHGLYIIKKESSKPVLVNSDYDDCAIWMYSN